MHTTLISAQQLHALVQTQAPVRVFDCSFDLLNPQLGPEAFAQGHIPGARHAHLNRDLSAHGDQATASGGRHPLPTREHFARWMRQHGITPSTQVVAYDRTGMNYCGRLWWMLKWCGHEAVAVLDGGWQAWQASGGATETGADTPPATHTPENTPKNTPDPSAALPPPGCPVMGTAALAAAVANQAVVVIDARGEVRFRGESEPIDPVAGHIPGAVNRPFAANLRPDGLFKPAEQLRAEFLQLLNGRDPATVVHHCGSGVSTMPNLLAMEVAGLGRQALYPGSWSEWCTTHPALPVATGPA